MARIFLRQALNLRLDEPVGDKKKGDVIPLVAGWNNVDDELLKHAYLRAHIRSAGDDSPPVDPTTPPANADQVTALQAQLEMVNGQLASAEAGVTQLTSERDAAIARADVAETALALANAKIDELSKAPPAVVDPAPLGSSTLSDPVVVGTETVPLDAFIKLAMARTALSATMWNAMSEDTRDLLISMEIDAARAAASAPNNI